MIDPLIKQHNDSSDFSFLSDPATTSFPLSTASPFDLQQQQQQAGASSSNTTAATTTTTTTTEDATVSIFADPTSLSRKRPRSPSFCNPLDEPAIARLCNTMDQPDDTSLMLKDDFMTPAVLDNNSIHTQPRIYSPRPSLRLHMRKGQVDPMKHRLDVNGISRLTLAILRRLGVIMTMNELPTVDISQHDENDSQHLLPTKAMEVITTMILGTSGDKDVSQTGSSQISNGDLVAIQRMVIAALRHKGLSINTIFPIQIVSANAIPEPSNTATLPSSLDYIDLSQVRYELSSQVTRLFYAYIASFSTCYWQHLIVGLLFNLYLNLQSCITKKSSILWIYPLSKERHGKALIRLFQSLSKTSFLFGRMQSPFTRTLAPFPSMLKSWMSCSKRLYAI